VGERLSGRDALLRGRKVLAGGEIEVKSDAPTLIVFVDGLGLGSADPAVNPVRSGACPCLAGFLDEDAVAIDVTMGVPGLPQSATGQTALLTGLNAAREVGRHVEGFPTAALAKLVESHNIFKQLIERGGTCTFANAYYVDHVSEVRRSAWKSVTTVATLSAFDAVRGKAELQRNQAVYQDLTRESLRSRGYQGPLVRPSDCAAHLVEIARGYDLTLFEYFQTDRAGHRMELECARRVLALFDEFLGALLPLTEHHGLRMILTSDHGNIEDLGRRTHNLNPVPFAVRGKDAARLRARVAALTDVTPAVLEVIL